MTKRPSITIGIPAYNESKNINRLLTNLLNQHAQNYILEEIIVISDACTDSTCLEVKKTPDKRIKLIENKKRFGQNLCQNEIIDRMSDKSDYLLLLEADTLPKNQYFIENLTKSIPKYEKFSMVLADREPVRRDGFFESVIRYGFYLRHEIYKKALSWPNLYLNTYGLFSREFLHKFRWDNQHHEDSYAYRKALESGLPLLRAKDAILLFKPVSNIRDYLLQSSKFQKARHKENIYSDIYNPNYDKVKLVLIIGKYFFSNPIYFLVYLLLIIVSRVYARFSPNYTPFWPIYYSSKDLKVTS